MSQNECCSIFQGRNICLPAILMAFQYSIVQPIPEPQDRRWQLWYHAGFSLPHGEPGELRDPRRYDAWQKHGPTKISTGDPMRPWCFFRTWALYKSPSPSISPGSGRSGNGMGRTVFALTGWNPNMMFLKGPIFSLQQSPNTSCSLFVMFFCLRIPCQDQNWLPTVWDQLQSWAQECVKGPDLWQWPFSIQCCLDQSEDVWSQVSPFFLGGGIWGNLGLFLCKLQNRSGISTNF